MAIFIETMHALKVIAVGVIAIVQTSCIMPKEVSPQSVIRNKKATCEELLSAIRKLPPTAEGPDLWASIANDPSYPCWHRRVCVIQLFRRHIRPGMTLESIGQSLNGAPWLAVEHIQLVTTIMGKIPLRIDANNSIFSVQILPQIGQNVSAIYLKVNGRMTEAQLYNLFTGQSSDATLTNKILIAIAFSENNPC